MCLIPTLNYVIPAWHVAVASFAVGVDPFFNKQKRSSLLGLHSGNVPHLHSPSTHALVSLGVQIFPAHVT